jgi:ParB family transcriptional regulator, chromosome partitioning protein
LTRPDFRTQAALRLAEEREELSPAIIDLLRPEGHGGVTDVRRVRTDRVDPNPDQPRLHIDEATINELAASIVEHGILQPVLVRPRPEGRYQLIAGERRWRAARVAGLAEIPAIVEEIDDEAALEIAIIENLQREDLSPLDEAMIYERMTSQHGYSLRKLARKLGKDKGYIENRLRLADAPEEIRQLVSLRKDTLSHAYELLKVDDPRKRRRLAEQVATGELSLMKLRERIEGRPRRPRLTEADEAAGPAGSEDVEQAIVVVPIEPPTPMDASEMLDHAADQLGQAIDELSAALRSRAVLTDATSNERQNFAKYLTLAKIKLENAIAVVRAGEPREQYVPREEHVQREQPTTRS